LRATIALVVVFTVGAVAVAVARSGGDADDLARSAADAFLDTYVEDDGRVVRTDEGGDTVSEGQAYALLISVAVGDEARFRQVWSWTEDHLQRDDGLLSWRWDGGQVVDPGPATDADLLASGALAIAGWRFADGELLDEAAVLRDAVLDHETLTTGDGPALVAGPWAREKRVVNPSYLVVGTMSVLWATGDHEWAPVAATSRAVLAEMTEAPPHLPPDWATVGAGIDDWQAISSPAGDGSRYGYDAARVLVQLAVDCDADGQAIAARPWSFLAGEADGTVEAVYALSGEPLVDHSHPVGLVAAAASAAAAGDPTRAGDLLDDAESLDGAHPSYFGSAWVALGRIWLDTDLLGGCRPGAPTR
jgi:endo-1,4-beta-D-glucanase Y